MLRYLTQYQHIIDISIRIGKDTSGMPQQNSFTFSSHNAQVATVYHDRLKKVIKFDRITNDDRPPKRPRFNPDGEGDPCISIIQEIHALLGLEEDSISTDLAQISVYVTGYVDFPMTANISTLANVCLNCLRISNALSSLD